MSYILRRSGYENGNSTLHLYFLVHPKLAWREERQKHAACIIRMLLPTSGPDMSVATNQTEFNMVDVSHCGYVSSAPAPVKFHLIYSSVTLLSFILQVSFCCRLKSRKRLWSSFARLPLSCSSQNGSAITQTE